MVKFIGSRKDLTEDKLEKLEEIVMDSTKVEAIYEAAKMSMGMYAQHNTRGRGERRGALYWNLWITAELG